MPCSSWTTTSPSAISPRSPSAGVLAPARASRVRARAEDLLLGDQRPADRPAARNPRRSGPTSTASGPARWLRRRSSARARRRRPRRRSRRKPQRAQQRRQPIGVGAVGRHEAHALPVVQPGAQAIAQRLAQVGLASSSLGGSARARCSSARRVVCGSATRCARAAAPSGASPSTRARPRPARSSTPPARRPAPARASSSPSTNSCGGKRQPVLDAPGWPPSRAASARVPPRLVEHRLGILDDEQRVRAAGSRRAAPSRAWNAGASASMPKNGSPVVDLLEQPARLRRRIDGGVGGGQELRARVGARRPDRLAHRVQVQPRRAAAASAAWPAS